MEKSAYCKLAEGKTKIIYQVPENHEVFIESKDDITAGDGEKRHVIEGKGTLANTTTCNCFELLRRADIPTHFIKKVDERTFRAHRARMIPIELVARRLATGSYLKRRPAVPEKTKFDPLVLEFFLKDDATHDPLIIPDPVGEQLLLFHPKRPLWEGYLREKAAEDPDWFFFTFIPKAKQLLTRTFHVLEEAWAKQAVMLVDLKIECGLIPERRIVVADVIDNDSWRIWPAGDKEQMTDKQVYRDLPEATPEDLGKIYAKYSWVAKATEKFVS